MKDGLFKVAAAAPDIRVGDCAHNAGEIVKLAWRASTESVHLLALPELSVTGSTCGDLFLNRTLQQAALASLCSICAETAALDIVLVVGLPFVFEGNLYNCAAVIHGGNVLGIVPQSAGSTSGLFAPYFGSTRELGGEILSGVPFGGKLLFCCDDHPDFTFGVEIGGFPFAPVSPAMRHTTAGAALIVHITADVEAIGMPEARHTAAKYISGACHCAYLRAAAGSGESTTDFVCSGHHILAENGHILTESAPFENIMAVTDIDTGRIFHERQHFGGPAADLTGYLIFSYHLLAPASSGKAPLTRDISPTPFVPRGEAELAARCESVLATQSHALQKRVAHTGVKKLVLGISGGLDSSLALVVCARALQLLERPMSDIMAVTMPCFGTTERTKSNAQMLCEAVGATFQAVDISGSVRQHFKDIGHDEADTAVVFENAQARMRTMVLMDIANQLGGLVVGTGDLSELALGWCTYGGDHLSMYAVNAGVPKTLIPHLLRHEAKKWPALNAPLCDICDTPISPELLPASGGEMLQKTEDIVGPYELHDFFLYYTVRWGFAPGKILRLALAAFKDKYDEQTVLKWMKLFFVRFVSQQFKRSCAADGPMVGSVTLSPRGGWQMPGDAAADIWLREIEALQAGQAE